MALYHKEGAVKKGCLLHEELLLENSSYEQQVRDLSMSCHHQRAFLQLPTVRGLSKTLLTGN